MSFFEELKRRNVFRVGIAYAVATWLLLQVTDIVFPRIGLPDSAVTLVIALLAIGFIPALIFAWAFEMTPEGIKREKDVDRTRSITPKTGRKLDYAIIGIMAVVIVFLVVDRFVLSEKGSESKLAGEVVEVINQGEQVSTLTPTEKGLSLTPDAGTSIAVLPFVNMSADADNEYFSDGISEELLNVLAKVNALRVASRTSSFNYKGSDLSMTEIAQELDVGHILEGSVRKAGNRVRITAQLINAKTDRHIWSETFERELDDIFDIQEEISNQIVAALKVVLNVDEAAAVGRAQRPTENPEAYELYLQGRFAWRQRHEENIRRSIQLFEKAIAIDPGFARAHEALASAWGVLPAWAAVSNRASTQKAKTHAMRALELDPTLAEARAILAEVAFDDHRWADAVAQYRQAIGNEPRNPTLHQWLGEGLTYIGFLSAGLTEIRIAYELDPASPVINQSLTWVAAMNREDDLVYRHVEIAKGLGVGDRAFLNSIDAMERRGDWDTVFEALDTINDVPAIVRSCLQARRDSSLTDQLSAQLDQYFDGLGEQRPSPLAMLCLSLTGQPERAASLTLTGIEDNHQNLSIFWTSNEQAGAMRQTGDFRKALADMGLLDYYRKNGWPDLCHPLGDDDFECDQ